MLTNVILASMILVIPVLVVEGQKPFDYMVLAQTWPPTFCGFVEKCTAPTKSDNFTIHGLWDNYNPWILSPGPCSKTPLDLKLIAPIKSELDKSWPNLKNPNANSVIWAHEWSKHGTCMTSVMDQIAYFTTTLHWKNAYDILSILKKSGLNPGGKHPEADVKTAIEKEVGFDVALKCFVPKSVKTVQYIVEVQFCVNRQGTQVISCTAMGLSTKGQCDPTSEITIPA